MCKDESSDFDRCQKVQERAPSGVPRGFLAGYRQLRRAEAGPESLQKDSVMARWEVNRNVAFLGAVPLHLRLLRRIGASL